MALDKKANIKEEVKEIPKPLSIITKEFKEQVYGLIDKYQIHPVLAEILVKDIYLEIKLIADNQARLEEQNYIKQIEEQKESSK